MKNHMHDVCSSTGVDEEKIIFSDHESSRSISSIGPYCWWRSAAKYDEYVKLKLDGGLPDVSKLTTRMRAFKELERLALVASGNIYSCSSSTDHDHEHEHELGAGVNELRHKLLMYRSGDFWMPTGGISKDKMDLPPVVTILLVGFSASGKTSLVNLMYSVLGRSGLVTFAQTSSSSSSSPGSCTTMVLKEHNVLRSMQNGLCVYDSRGFDYNDHCMGTVEDELSSWMVDGVHQNQKCSRPGDPDDDVTSDHVLTKDVGDHVLIRSKYDWTSKFVRRRVNCVMVVANMAEIYKAYKAGDNKPMETTRQLFCSSALRNCNDEKPMLILTHGDMLSAEERIEGRLKICEFVGASESSGVYDIVCLTEYGFLAEQSDPVSAYALIEAVYRALLISDRTHLPMKTPHDWGLHVLSLIMCFLSSLFALLSEICFKLGGGGGHQRRN